MGWYGHTPRGVHQHVEVTTEWNTNLQIVKDTRMWNRGMGIRRDFASSLHAYWHSHSGKDSSSCCAQFAPSELAQWWGMDW